jgi:UDP-N-acetylmuramoyl-L-alanine---L-glutamate ligase
VETIILGGSEKNIDFNDLAKEILKTKIKNLIFFPLTGQKIYSAIMRQNKKKKKLNLFLLKEQKNYNKNQYMEKAVNLAYKYSSKGKICLFSPASASFNLFQDYKQRGDLFKKYVKIFAKRKND